jgi:hypothetical protein
MIPDPADNSDISSRLAINNMDNSLDDSLSLSPPARYINKTLTPPGSSTPNAHGYKVQKPAQLRGTCETCRKLKVRCKPSPNSNQCVKCTKKGTVCVHLPRADYVTKTRGTR